MACLAYFSKCNSFKVHSCYCKHQYFLSDGRMIISLSTHAHTCTHTCIHTCTIPLYPFISWWTPIVLMSWLLWIMLQWTWESRDFFDKNILIFNARLFVSISLVISIGCHLPLFFSVLRSKIDGCKNTNLSVLHDSHIKTFSASWNF